MSDAIPCKTNLVVSTPWCPLPRFLDFNHPAYEASLSPVAPSRCPAAPPPQSYPPPAAPPGFASSFASATGNGGHGGQNTHKAQAHTQIQRKRWGTWKNHWHSTARFNQYLCSVGFLLQKLQKFMPRWLSFWCDRTNVPWLPLWAIKRYAVFGVRFPFWVQKTCPVSAPNSARTFRSKDRSQTSPGHLSL